MKHADCHRHTGARSTVTARCMTRLTALVILALAAPIGLGIEAGDPAPDFAAPALDGGAPIRLADFKGQVVYLDFWASWCKPCRESLPLLSAMREELRTSGFEVVAIDVDENPDDGRAFLERFPVTYPVASDPRGKVTERYDVLGMPSSFLIDRDGIVRYVKEGFKTKDMAAIRARILALL